MKIIKRVAAGFLLLMAVGTLMSAYPIRESYGIYSYPIGNMLAGILIGIVGIILMVK